MTTKQLIKYAGEKLKNHDSVFFFVNKKRVIKPYAPRGEKYGIAYKNTNTLLDYADNINNAKEMINYFIKYHKY